MTFGRQHCGLGMKTSTTTFSLCLGNRRLTSGAVVTLAKGSGQLAIEDASSDVIRYLGGGVHRLIRGGKGSSSFETEGAKLRETVVEDATSS